MSPTIPSIRPAIIAEIVAPAAAQESGAPSSGEFRDILASAVGAVERGQHAAQTAVESFLSGDSTELHSVALASQRADLSMDLFLQVRNKVLSAYQEIMKMQM